MVSLHIPIGLKPTKTVAEIPVKTLIPAKPTACCNSDPNSCQQFLLKNQQKPEYPLLQNHPTRLELHYQPEPH